MRFQTPLVPARLIRRYKRFLADCRLADGREVVAHVANPGSMIGLADPETKVWLEPNDDPRKKLDYAWRLAQVGSATIGVDTGAANRVMREALEARTIEAFAAYGSVRPEVRYSEGSRIDFLLSAEGRPDLYLEVKSVTLSRRRGQAEFPDSVTARGLKHLGDLAAMARLGHRAVLAFVVMRDDTDVMRLAEDLDPAYASGMRAALAAGVEVCAIGCALSPEGVTIRAPIALDIDQFGAANLLQATR
ncbi:DNA/RNA nuclease SfsA [Cognatishimia sp. F0-27]|uniref:DNA/RNA nuclease SfsA n=1 Tax=Cognatishimia sp. F0-27 TaxID=2816855 RepID=UPI001D0CC418|nr:DNA/RNA nuclease SfsA [Cognatishimia sp. F0-27]MCC1491060.1 DNA/RNA nuclease SfsA [Cognatishimia sp. F0-27]